jgi:hypothetical protein
MRAGSSLVVQRLSSWVTELALGARTCDYLMLLPVDQGGRDRVSCDRGRRGQRGRKSDESIMVWGGNYSQNDMAVAQRRGRSGRGRGRQSGRVVCGRFCTWRMMPFRTPATKDRSDTDHPNPATLRGPTELVRSGRGKRMEVLSPRSHAGAVHRRISREENPHAP